MARRLPKLVLEAAPIAMLAGAGVLALRGTEPVAPKGVRPRGGGRGARSPLQIPLQGWKEILVRTRGEFTQDQIPMIAAGVSFYTLLAIFPGLAAFVALYGLFSDVAQAQHHLQMLSVVLPASALQFFGDEMLRMAAAQKGGLSITFILGLVTSIWSANGAVKALMTGLSIAYEAHDKRSFIHKTLISMVFTLGFLAFGTAAITVLGAGPAVEAYLGHHAAFMLNVVSWPILLVAMGVGIALLYRYGPGRGPARLQWISPGSLAALILWIAVSAAFSLYVGNFAHYDRTYGSLGAVVGFMVWNWLTNIIILAGGELNAEVEAQTRAV
ncbi:YihY/virulence factor BrkB family protein [Phenylobacterium sp.]|uniref:YihY/virulence factor BrkB family protein n=1 Tax=Phenylobacterium sp. TaxID=1871053 RepID=UPI002DEE4900|nr:YihY/virulence factor BrkB family protein [Phenylobacterium sp.]